eukprot:117215-Rhodomonas_salina.2
MQYSRGWAKVSSMSHRALVEAYDTSVVRAALAPYATAVLHRLAVLPATAVLAPYARPYDASVPGIA